MQFILNLPKTQQGENLPSCSGIYFVMDESKGEIVYVGQSIQLDQRWKNHQIVEMLSNFTVYYLTKGLDNLSIRILEKFFIWALCPKFNSETQIYHRFDRHKM